MAHVRAKQTGARIMIIENIDDGVRGVDFIHTDVWVSMGEPKEVWDERVRLLKPYQVHAGLLEKAGNPGVKFMHCLPAFHNRQTKIGEEIQQKTGLEGMGVHEEGWELDGAFRGGAR